ncbi:MAG: tRNA (adenosine(37)-N6)-threonylcarbamoyltransferase complex ATPase subunit type 1 TsaE [Bacteroidota bacterium]|nr:tRNA (adenosine(37)-N6)-threonylcarbamoyltransferase complex ATPase subunit type 1 TsaE [Bacteroidota bacterium]MDP4213474.1 tRNA (adenosine(37)-N6)-threonylcarbamoyltransferase complex ATPase subunit type 1 TsaE [Bacteroidota bacterium]MDP4249783.1 tRNA (adenosine(37)-N6)-threonylcarbamoyltransferase complex ATPase subunit type 1 TsaE [Bacteroidota bacterium]
MERIFTLSDLKSLAEEFWLSNPDKKIFSFSGQLGAGKTTFIHALCAVKKVQDTVSSPTFSIINEYGYPGGTIFHIDLYRIKDEDEAIRAGVEDCLYSGDICLVEWPERAPGIFPPGSLHSHFETIDKTHRKIQVTGS